jgi:hypothetical protein
MAVRPVTSGLRRQWPGWLIGGIVLAIIATGTIAVACNH